MSVTPVSRAIGNTKANTSSGRGSSSPITSITSINFAKHRQRDLHKFMTGGGAPLFKLKSTPTHTKVMPATIDPTINKLRGKTNKQILDTRKMFPDPRPKQSPFTAKQPGVQSSTGGPNTEPPSGATLEATGAPQQVSDETRRPQYIDMINIDKLPQKG